MSCKEQFWESALQVAHWECLLFSCVSFNAKKFQSIISEKFRFFVSSADLLKTIILSRNLLINPQYSFNLFDQSKEAEGESKKEEEKSKGDEKEDKEEKEEKEEEKSEKGDKEPGEQELEKKEEAEEVGNSKESDKDEEEEDEEEEEDKNSEVELSPSHIPSAPPQETIQGP